MILLPGMLAAMLLAASDAGVPSEAGQPALTRPAAAIPMAWRLARELDSGTGRRSCRLTSLGGDVTARLEASGPEGKPAWRVWIGHDNEPGSLRYLRVGRRVFTTAEESFGGAEAAEIAAALMVPGEFAFEWAKRPDYAKHLGLFGTGDFAAKAALCQDWIEGTRA